MRRQLHELVKSYNRMCEDFQSLRELQLTMVTHLARVQIMEPAHAADEFDAELDGGADDRYAGAYYEVMKRRGVTEQEALSFVRASTTLQAALMVRLGEADTMICGSIGRFQHHLQHMIRAAGQLDDVQHRAEGRLELLSRVRTVVQPNATAPRAPGLVRDE